MTDNGVGLRDGIGCRLGGAEARDQACKRNRIGGGERNNALPQRSLGERFGHRRFGPRRFANRRFAHRRHTHSQASEDRLPDDKQPSGKEIPTPSESPPDNPRHISATSSAMRVCRKNA
jgi:hypothetical protein